VRMKGSNQTQRNEGSGRNSRRRDIGNSVWMGGANHLQDPKRERKTSAEKNCSLKSVKNEAGNGGSSRSCADETEEWEEQTVGTKT
jgi:hypothetical protein